MTGSKKLTLLVTLLVGLMGGAESLHAAGHRCGTPERLQQALANRQAADNGPIVFAAGDKETRENDGDWFESGYEVQVSDNFALRWKGTKPAQADYVLATLEESYAHFHGTLGHALAHGGNQYRMNVYTGNDNTSPAIDFDGGYASLDEGGYPYIVISDLIGSNPNSTDQVVPHEYYHTVQFGTLSFETGSGWYWEASAEWAAINLWPQKDAGYGHAPAYMLTQHAPLFYFGDFSGDEHWALGTHQYGALVFPVYVAQHYGDSVIVDSWKTGGQEQDALKVLDRLIPDRTIGEIFAEFAAHNAYWDYAAPSDQLLQELSDSYDMGPADPDGWNRIVATVPVEGTSDWVDVADNVKPGAFGYNLIEVAVPENHEVTFEIEGEATGSMGNGAKWGAVVARKPQGTPSYNSAQVSGGTGSVQLVSRTGETKMYLAVSVTSDSRRNEERFTYRYKVAVGDQVDPEEEDPDDPDTPDTPDTLDAMVIGGCSMSSGSRVPDASVFLLVLVFAFLRRRATHRA